MTDKIKKIIAREGSVLLLALSCAILFYIYHRYQLSPHAIFRLPLVALFMYLLLTIPFALLRKLGNMGKTDEYKALFDWWFWWGIKMALAAILLGIFHNIALGKMPPPSETIGEFEHLRNMILIAFTLVTSGAICGLFAVGLKKIRDDELFKLWR